MLVSLLGVEGLLVEGFEGLVVDGGEGHGEGGGGVGSNK